VEAVRLLITATAGMVAMVPPVGLVRVMAALAVAGGLR
jgi:hypothetical protein